MTKGDLINLVSDSANMPRTTAEKAVNTIFEAITEALISGRRIEIRNFGNFEVRHYGAYVGWNPRTHEKNPVDEKRGPFFKAGREMRERIAMRADSR